EIGESSDAEANPLGQLLLAETGQPPILAQLYTERHLLCDYDSTGQRFRLSFVRCWSARHGQKTANAAIVQEKFMAYGPIRPQNGLQENASKYRFCDRERF